MTAPAPTTPEVDHLAEFKSALATAIANAPEVDEAANKAVISQYVSLERNFKTSARSFIEAEALDAVRGQKYPQAEALTALRDAMVSAAKSAAATTPRRPRNRTNSVVQSIASIQIGFSLAMLAAMSDQDLDEGWQDKMNELCTPEKQAEAKAYYDWLASDQSGPEPEVADVAAAGARIAHGRAPKGQGRKKGSTAAPSAPVSDATVEAFNAETAADDTPEADGPAPASAE